LNGARLFLILDSYVGFAAALHHSALINSNSPSLILVGLFFSFVKAVIQMLRLFSFGYTFFGQNILLEPGLVKGLGCLWGDVRINVYRRYCSIKLVRP
jgi:hypothetical protein